MRGNKNFLFPIYKNQSPDFEAVVSDDDRNDVSKGSPHVPTRLFKVKRVAVEPVYKQLCNTF